MGSPFSRDPRSRNVAVEVQGIGASEFVGKERRELDPRRVVGGGDDHCRLSIGPHLDDPVWPEVEVAASIVHLERVEFDAIAHKQPPGTNSGVKIPAFVATATRGSATTSASVVPGFWASQSTRTSHLSSGSMTTSQRFPA